MGHDEEKYFNFCFENKYWGRTVCDCSTMWNNFFPLQGNGSATRHHCKNSSVKISSSFFSSKPSKLHGFFSQTLKNDYMIKVHQILLRNITKNMNKSQQTPINTSHKNSNKSYQEFKGLHSKLLSSLKIESWLARGWTNATLCYLTYLIGITPNKIHKLILNGSSMFFSFFLLSPFSNP